MKNESDGAGNLHSNSDSGHELAAARFRKADAVFDTVLDSSSPDREALLTELCGSDHVLRDDVARLLRAHDKIGSVLDTSAASFAAPMLDDAAPESGALVSRYRLIRRLGRGGMGEVWLAEDVKLEREVAIKIIRDSAEVLGDRTARVRAIREARAVARLDHPNVAGIYDVGETPNGALWFAMPFCSGGSLADRLRNGPLPVAEVMHIGRQIASALSAAHAQGIVHRDIKPDNALIDASGNIRLSDFGIAKWAGAETALTRGVIGTMHYVSPEQIAGEPVDARSDLWALGVTLFELAAGHRPFSGTSDAALLHAIMSGVPALLPVGAPLGAQLSEVLTQLLQKNPADRPASAAEVAQRLVEPAGAISNATDATPSNIRSGAGAHARSHKPQLLAACGLAAIIALIAALWQRPRTLPPPADGSASQRSLAVLPFDNTSRAVADEPFVDGLTEEVISVLGRVPGLRVSSRTSTFALRGKGLSAREIADTLGVENLLEASVRREGDQLRVTARLIRASDGSIRWSEEYNRQLRDIFKLQGEVAVAIASALQPRLSGESAFAPTLQKGTSDLVAYENFLEARYQRARRTPDRLRAAVVQFQQAISRDSLFARAWGALSTTYVLQTLFADESPRRVMPDARAAALRSIAIDSTVAEGYAALAHINMVFDFDWRGAEARAARAGKMDPVNETVRMVSSLTLLDTRRLAEARSILQEARSRDPLDASVLVTLGRVELEDGRVAESIALFEHVVAINSAFAYGHEQLGYGLLAAGRNTEAERAFRTAATLAGANDSAHLAYALAVTGDKAQARRIVERLELSASKRRLPTVALAVAHAGLGDADGAFMWLERAWTERAAYLDGVAILPGLKSLAGDPRWSAFLTRMGLKATVPG
ncbi:MAG: protein kinase [Phycisphaerae bacterium]|nr:protein kinase [Gemmatimonadaceae bacterium]